MSMDVLQVRKRLELINRRVLRGTVDFQYALQYGVHAWPVRARFFSIIYSKKTEKTMAIVLVHGAWCTARLWDQCRSRLNGSVLAVELPTQLPNARQITIDDYVQAIIAEMDAARITSATLVGHSFAGVALCVLANRFPERVQRLVFLSGLVPASGQPPVSSLLPDFQTLLNEQRSLGLDSIEFPEAAIPGTFNDCNREQIEFAKGCIGAQPLAPFFEAVAVSTVEARILCHYVKLLRDQVFTPAMQEGFAARLAECTVTPMDTGHCPMVSQPVELASIINRLTD
jgi:pimeloyl-ACP methyl ester carboxylesterase